ncbi:MAG: ribonuclease E/G, partial [Gaiellaceae bacterium]
VIDFIDMANPKNRAAVEEALKTELERDRTKTYVVEISPLGLVEMTRQNVSHGPREILTKRCPTCEGDGIVFSEVSAAVEAERKLRMLAASSRSAAFRVELNPHVAAALIGPGAERLRAIEERTRRRFFIEPKEGVPPEHFEVVARGPLAKLQPESPLEEGQELTVKPVEVGLHDPSVGVAKHDGFDIAVAGGAKLVGKRAKVRISRVLDGTAFAELVDGAKPTEPPITAEALAEKPTRARRSRIAKPEEPKAEAVAEGPEAEAVAEGPEAEEPTEEGAAEEAPKPKKRTRRGSRGGRRRKKKPAEATAEAAPAEGADNGQPAEAPVLIHLPDPALGDDAAEPAATPTEASADGEAPKPKKKTRRGSRGGRRRRKPAAAKANGASTAGETVENPDKPLVD